MLVLRAAKSHAKPKPGGVELLQDHMVKEDASKSHLSNIETLNNLRFSDHAGLGQLFTVKPVYMTHTVYMYSLLLCYFCYQGMDAACDMWNFLL